MFNARQPQPHEPAARAIVTRARGNISAWLSKGKEGANSYFKATVFPEVPLEKIEVLSCFITSIFESKLSLALPCFHRLT